jgi:cysteine desulfurase
MVKNKKPIYFDNAASTLVDSAVVASMLPYLSECYANPGSVHTAGRKAREAIEYARLIIAQSINAKPEEIVFTSGGTESNALALHNRKVVATAVEHPSVLEHADVVCGVDEFGAVDIDELEKKMGSVDIVSAIHGNHEVGTVNDIAAIGKLCHTQGVLFHVDASQSFLKVPIDVKMMNIDLLTLNAHKIHGPKGVGALYVRSGVKVTPLFRGGKQENGFRAGTENVPGIVGFGKAVQLWKGKYNLQMKKHRDMLITALIATGGVLNGHSTKRLCHNVNVSFNRLLGEDIVRHLDAQSIYVSTGSACTTQEVKPSHVLCAMGVSNERALGAVRLSLSRFTKKEDIKRAIDIIRSITTSLGQL